MPFRDEGTKAILCRADGYHWRVCVECGSAYPSSTTSLVALQRYWDANRIEDLQGEEISVWEQRLQASHHWAEQTWQFLSPHLGRERGRFLDIACGLGATVSKFQDQGWQATGIDADPNTRRIHHQLGIETVIGQFEGVETLGRFDLISIAHAIYFISDPKQFLRRVRESLEDRGLFLVLISNLTSALGDAYPSQVTTWYPTAESLSNALVLEGFEVVVMRKHKGSIFVLARSSEMAVVTKGSAWVSALALRTQAWRHRLYGRQILWLGRLAKRLLRIGGSR
jgi:SAM-dependent methyltransferase